MEIFSNLSLPVAKCTPVRTGCSMPVRSRRHVGAPVHRGHRPSSFPLVSKAVLVVPGRARQPGARGCFLARDWSRAGWRHPAGAHQPPQLPPCGASWPRPRGCRHLSVVLGQHHPDPALAAGRACALAPRSHSETFSVSGRGSVGLGCGLDQEGYFQAHSPRRDATDLQPVERRIPK